MSLTQVRSAQLEDGGVRRADLNTTTAGSAVVAKLIQGTAISLSSTGADSGTGDVTVNLADISATQRVVGRNSAGAGPREELTVSQVLDWISSTRGAVLYRGASGWAALGAGTAGQVLKSNGAGADPTWSDMLTAAIDTTNSTTSTLTASSTFTGTSASGLGYASVSVTVLASHASATDGLAVEQSIDGTNWDIADYTDVAANQATTFTVNLEAEFYRVLYVNGGTNQTTFRLETKQNPWRLNRPGLGRSNAKSKTARLAASSTADTAIVSAPGTNKSILVRGFSATNDNASTLVRAAFKDGSTSIYEMDCAANGGGFLNPLKDEVLITENTAFNVALSANVSSVYCNAEFCVVKS